MSLVLRESYIQRPPCQVVYAYMVVANCSLHIDHLPMAVIQGAVPMELVILSVRSPVCVFFG